jgi:uncharacterized protein
MFHNYSMSERLSSFMYGVYTWMACALAVTACTAYSISLFPQAFAVIYAFRFPIFLVQFGLVMGLSWFLHRLSLTSALLMFLLYSVLIGVTFSFIFYVYTMASIISTFLTVAGMFGGMAIYGYMTRTDLTAIGNIAIMMLLGLILGLFVNKFFHNPGIDYMLSGAGVIIFTLLTAYDVQKIKQIGQQVLVNQEEMEQGTIEKATILGALTLYLDFINLFLFLLRFMGKRRN